MRLSISLDSFRARLFAALALIPAAGCGSAVDDGGQPAPLPSCEAPQPLVPGADTGFLSCTGNWIHRPEVATCPSQLPRSSTCATVPELDSCATDADCAAQPHGYCSSAFDGGCSCSYGCVTDTDCQAGQVCLCGDPVGRCVAASCTTDADCGEGLCATAVENPHCGATVFLCQSAADQCMTDADCPQGGACALIDGHRACTNAICVIGRPFLVEGEERTAPEIAREDWQAAGWAPRVEGLDAADREALAAHWARAGRMEHASVAAFARFALQLLALGAPPELVRDTQAAMADETEHAAICFALSSAYAGRGVGPGPLSIAGALTDSDPAAILVTAFREGCVGETVASLEAAEAAARAVDPVVRRALERIAADEARHAELAWRFLAWALRRDPSLRAAAEAELRAAQAASCVAAPEVAGGGRDLLAHGVVGDPLRRAIRRRALAEVIAPCAAALLGAQPGGTGGKHPAPSMSPPVGPAVDSMS